MSVILKMNTNSFPGIQLLKPCDFNEPILKNYSMIKVRDLLTKKLLCPIEQSSKQDKVNNADSVSVFLIDLLIGQGCCHGGPG